MPRHAANPNWGKPEVESTAPVITEFEKKVLELRLSPDQYISSAALREWVARNRNVRYVPEPLLDAWGFRIDTSL
jgi:hypothetical protein